MKSEEALLTRFESVHITPPPLSDTVRERVKRDAWTAFLTVGAASLAWMLAKPIPPPVGSLVVQFSATHRPRKWLESSAPLGLAVSGFFISIPTTQALNRGDFSLRDAGAPSTAFGKNLKGFGSGGNLESSPR